ncbi:ATPase, T2SS/T4P/T4SS family [Candidatus Magnetobacterium casense]|uniref:ATPase, T2SS/T4P/T4SS family n=1 Tax=Candidatus Magnetobacterium casense TaxID=1455061 RepID=UPI00058D869D|nr:AAA family ATPase [Candidatus Magnetobacterium casensis]
MQAVTDSEIDNIQEIEVNVDGFEEDQKEALNKALANKVFILTGAPGTGKTYTLKKIIEVFKSQKVILAAPTGKAAKRIYEQTGIEACTIPYEDRHKDSTYYRTDNAVEVRGAFPHCIK